MSNTVNNYTETDLGNISLNPRGEYDDSAAYEYLDTVSYQGGSYFCLAELETTITGIAPDAGRNSEHWQMIAAPGDMTPEYTAAYNNVINKAVQVEASRAAVELAQQEIEAVQTDVQQLHSDTVQMAQQAENSKNSAANSAQSAEQSRKTVSESEQNINGQITGFDSRVSEAVEQSKEEINTTKQQAIDTITNQQTTSVNTVKTEGEKIITRVGNDAKTVADDRATVEEATQTVLNNAQEVAQNTQTVAGNMENAAASAESAKTSADNAAQSAKSVEDASKQIEQNKKDVASLKEDKITKPAEAPTIGKILRVKSVNEDGTFVCEWADDGGNNLDVRIDGESIVQDGVAEIPLCTTSTAPGLISIDLYSNNGGLYRANEATGLIRIANAKNTSIDKRENSFCPIVPENLDYAVKAAMCDGKGATWTAEEQAAARKRMRAWSGDWQIIMDETLAELAPEVSFEVPDDTKEMICFFKSGETLVNTQVYLRTDNSGTSIAESFAPFGGSLLANAISIGCQKIQFINSQYGLVEYNYLSHATPSSADDAQRLGKASILRIDKKRFFFHSVESDSGYPVGTRLLVLVRR